jgi:hypothetical protein
MGMKEEFRLLKGNMVAMDQTNQAKARGTSNAKNSDAAL